MTADILEYNKKFVEEHAYEKYRSGKYPEKKLAILTCMDTRLTELLPAALGIKNGDAKIIKNAGAVITHPYGSVVRSLLVAILELGVRRIMVIGHTDCGVQGLDADHMMEQLMGYGVAEETIRSVEEDGVDIQKWLAGFASVEESVKNTVQMLENHPLIPENVEINGFVMDIVTGKLQTVEGLRG